jgi:hypothetical protein
MVSASHGRAAEASMPPGACGFSDLDGGPGDHLHDQAGRLGHAVIHVAQDDGVVVLEVRVKASVVRHQHRLPACRHSPAHICEMIT